jgi:hypothetical protein
MVYHLRLIGSLGGERQSRLREDISVWALKYADFWRTEYPWRSWLGLTGERSPCQRVHVAKIALGVVSR